MGYGWSIPYAPYLPTKLGDFGQGQMLVNIPYMFFFFSCDDIENERIMDCTGTWWEPHSQNLPMRNERGFLWEWGSYQPRGAHKFREAFWFKGKFTLISWEHLWFPVDVPLNQSIDSVVPYSSHGVIHSPSLGNGVMLNPQSMDDVICRFLVEMAMMGAEFRVDTADLMANNQQL